MIDTRHLHALELALSHERERLRLAKSDQEIALRTAWVAQCEKEVAGERAFLGLSDPSAAPEMTDDELLRALNL